MNLNENKIGKVIQFFGWFVFLFNVVKYGYGVYDTLSDASVRVYAPLIVFEGALYAGSGLFIVWFGGLIGKKTEKQKAPENVL